MKRRGLFGALDRFVSALYDNPSRQSVVQMTESAHNVGRRLVIAGLVGTAASVVAAAADVHFKPVVVHAQQIYTPDSSVYKVSVDGGWFYPTSREDLNIGYFVPSTIHNLWEKYGYINELGLPISRPIRLGHEVGQVFQKGVLLARTDIVARILDTYTILAQLGQDEWLHAYRHTPRSREWKSGEDRTILFNNPAYNTEEREAIAEIKKVFYAKGKEFFGEPVSVETFVDRNDEVTPEVTVLRTEINAIQYWHKDFPWATKESVKVSNVGEIARERGLFHPEIWKPHRYSDSGKILYQEIDITRRFDPILPPTPSAVALPATPQPITRVNVTPVIYQGCPVGMGLEWDDTGGRDFGLYAKEDQYFDRPQDRNWIHAQVNGVRSGIIVPIRPELAGKRFYWRLVANTGVEKSGDDPIDKCVVTPTATPGEAHVQTSGVFVVPTATHTATATRTPLGGATPIPLPPTPSAGLPPATPTAPANIP